MGVEAPAGERARWRELLGRVFDAETFERLERVGVESGWTALDVGTGAGSVADWLARRVAPAGGVVATDVEPGYAVIDAPNVEVLRHDVLVDDFAPVQEPWIAGGLLPSDPVAERVIRDLGTAELDGGFARRLPDALRVAGLERIEVDGSRESFTGGSELASFLRHTLAGAAAPLLATGELGRAQVAEMLARFDDPSWSGQAWPRIAATGRKVASSRGLRAGAVSPA